MSQEVYAQVTVWRGIKHIHPGKRMYCLVCSEPIESGQDVINIWFKGTEPRDYHIHCARQLTLILSKLIIGE